MKGLAHTAVLALRSLTAHMCRHESIGLQRGVALLQPSFSRAAPELYIIYPLAPSEGL